MVKLLVWLPIHLLLNVFSGHLPTGIAIVLTVAAILGFIATRR